MDKFEIAIIRQFTSYSDILHKYRDPVIQCEYTPDEVDAVLLEKGIMTDKEKYYLSNMDKALGVLSEMGFELKAIFEDKMMAGQDDMICVRFFLQRRV